LDFDESLSQPLREVPGMGDWGGDKGGLPAGSQREASDINKTKEAWGMMRKYN